MPPVTDRWYCTLDDLRAEIGETGTANDALLSRYIAQASQWIETATGRTFYPVSATLYFDAPRRDPGTLFLEYADLLTLGALTDGGGAISTAACRLYPLNLSPKYTIVLDTAALGRGFQYGADPRQAIAVAGQWGYCADYINTGMVLDAAIVTPTATKISIGGSVSAGMMLILDNEALHVSAVSGTIATVQRGALGTTAATHSAGATVWMYTPPADIRLAVMALATSYNNARVAGGVKSESIGEYSVTYTGSASATSVPAGVQAIVNRYRRIGL